MTSFIKPRINRKTAPTNKIGLTRQDYDGTMSTLCAGCGHDSVTAALARARASAAVTLSCPHPAHKVDMVPS